MESRIGKFYVAYEFALALCENMEAKWIILINEVNELFLRLKQHVDDSDKLPILIFPEGTCINNTSVMQFKKGSFEVGSVVYPVAIKVNTL